MLLLTYLNAKILFNFTLFTTDKNIKSNFKVKEYTCITSLNTGVLHPCVVAQSCLTLCNHVDCSSLGLSIHGFYHVRILERTAISFSKGSSLPGIELTSPV